MTIHFGSGTSSIDDIDSGVDQKKLIRQRIRAQAALQNLASNLPLETVVDYLVYIESQDVQDEIDKRADSYEGHGRTSPYERARLEVSKKHTIDPVLASRLVDFYDKLYKLEKSTGFNDLIGREIENQISGVQSSVGNVLSQTNDSTIVKETQEGERITGGVSNSGIEAVSDDEYIEQMEGMHFGNLDENDQGDYLILSAECKDGLRSRSDLVNYWRRKVK